MAADGNLFLERFPLGSDLSQQLGSSAFILLLRKAEAASENTFALTGLLFCRVDMLWLNSELLNSTCALKNKMKTRERFELPPLTHIWLNSPLFLLRRQMWYDRVPLITQTSSASFLFLCPVFSTYFRSNWDISYSGAFNLGDTFLFWILFQNATSKVASLEYQHVSGFSFF